MYVDILGNEKDLMLGEILLDEASVSLDGVTVTASGTTSRSDRKLVYPSNRQVDASSDGATLHRREHGEMYWQNLSSSYSFQNDKQMFSTTFRYYTSNNPHWDYKGSLYNVTNPADVVQMVDNTASKSHRPALDLYYQQNLKNDQTLVFNLVRTYHYTDNTRFYQESRNDSLLTHVNNMVIGDKYSLIGEGIYEKK